MIAYCKNRKSTGHGTPENDPRLRFLVDLFALLRLPFAALDHEGRIVASNEAFTRLDLRLLSSNGSTRSPKIESDEFSRLVDKCLSNNEEVFCTCVSQTDNYIVDLRPLHDRLSRTPTQSLAIVVAYCLGSFKFAPQDSLKQFFGMTARESDITKLLITGHSIEQIAILHNVSVGTVRGQLKSIFRKSGASRQSELFAKFCY
jgi:DNA-binding CsgD family transcriptional regulator